MNEQEKKTKKKNSRGKRGEKNSSKMSKSNVLFRFDVIREDFERSS